MKALQQPSKQQKQPPEAFCKQGILRSFAKFTVKHMFQSLFVDKLQAKAYNFIKKETLVQVFSCKFCEICKDTFSYRTPPLAASETTPYKATSNKDTYSEKRCGGVLKIKVTEAIIHLW